MSSDIRILLADDDVIVREGLASLLDHRDGLKIAATAENGKQVLQYLAHNSADIVLLDVDMPVLDGISAAAEIRSRYPDIAVIMLTAFEHQESLAKSLALNVRGFLTKDVPSAKLAELIKEAYAGKSVFTQRPTDILTHSYVALENKQSEYQEFREKIESLPHYLRTVFDLLIQAMPNKNIARELEITESTVRTYITKLYSVTGCTNRGELTIAAIRAGY
ncbi:response regulator transcription factor [Arcanobacterium hippocoleae]